MQQHNLPLIRVGIEGVKHQLLIMLDQHHEEFTTAAKQAVNNVLDRVDLIQEFEQHFEIVLREGIKREVAFLADNLLRNGESYNDINATVKLILRREFEREFEHQFERDGN